MVVVAEDTFLPTINRKIKIPPKKKFIGKLFDDDKADNFLFQQNANQHYVK